MRCLLSVCLLACSLPEAAAAAAVPEQPKLLISEIADPSGTGGGNFRFAELYNAGTDAIDLASGNWHLSKQVNGGTGWSDIPLTGTVAAASAWVIAYSAPDFRNAYGFAPDQESGSVSGTGNDAYFLYCGGKHTNGTLIDIYGEFNTDGTDTAWDYEDSRAMRNNNILQPSPVWTAAEWNISAGAEVNDMTPGKHGPEPEFENLINPFVFLGDSLSLTVTAVNIVSTDVITLSATALPAGAAFPPATGTGSVSSTLIWSSPAAGVYTVTFSADGSAGTRTASITVTVSGVSRIDGKFHGWSGGTVFKLENGQFWQQTVSGSKSVPVMSRPVVTVTNIYGNHQMTVDGVSGSVKVSLLNVAESTVTGAFTGLHYENIYQLADGTAWKQISFENISGNTAPVTVWRWTENDRQTLRFLDRNDAVIGTCTVEASGGPVSPPAVSEIDGWFPGWKYKRVFALSGGQFWQQTSSDNSPQTLYCPAVVITNHLQTGNWRMSVEGLPGYISVQPLTNVIRTAINGMFYGFGKGRIFKLADGTWWRQTSSGSSTSARSTPVIFMWKENETDYLDMPDEGKTVTAEKLNVYLESAVTGAFSGLHHGNLYRLDGAGDWLQLSFENVSANTVNPNVMLWAEGTQTGLLVRDSRDVTIGTCIVAHPDGDSDSDGLRNADEVLAGFDPLDERSQFELRRTGRCVLSWNAVENRIYMIEWAPSLTESFQPLETGIVWPQNCWTDAVHSVETKGFYRISVRRAE